MSTTTPPTTELPKTYDPAAVEPDANRVWQEEGHFHAEPSDPGKPYSIVIPPPNVTAALHLGHALNNTLQDILTRVHRMMGDNTCWFPGTDHAGIATQTVVEKRVLAEEGKRRTDFQRDEFIAKIQAWKDEYECRITEQLKRMGCSCDWDRQAFTMDEPRARAVREAFFQLFKDGLIYRGKRLVNWDPVTQTALADDEVEMEEVEGAFYYLRYPLADVGATPASPSSAAQQGDAGVAPTYVTVATTRPETMLGDTAVAINPKDPRAKELRGKHVRLPIVNREIPIIEDDYVVLPVSMGGDEKDPKAQFATGFLKVTPAHDPNDYDIGQRHKLPMINVFAPDATISDKHGWTDIGDAGFLLGKDRFAARELVVKWFKEHGLLEEIKPYKHTIGHSYRSHVPIEPWLSDQWYCKVTDDRLAGAALRAMDPNQREPVWATPASPSSTPDKRATQASPLHFFPARYARTFQTWHENIRDWCISRQLWWGHRIPVWDIPCDDKYTFDDLWQHFQHHPAVKQGLMACQYKLDPTREEARERGGQEYAAARVNFPYAHIYVCLSENRPQLVSECNLYGSQDPDVLDTWFSSGLWPMSTMQWPDESQISNLRSALNTWNPTSVLCTAREIITLWVSRMVMFNLYFLNRLPFAHVFIHAMIQDGHGQKMSKSLGNGVDPVDIIHRHGADAMRFTLASMATNTQDVRMPVDMVDPHSQETFTPKYITDSAGHMVAAPIQESPKDPKKKMVSSYGVASGQVKPTPGMPAARNTSSKFDLGRNFCNKLWNAARFAMMNLGKAAQEPVDESKWSLADRWIVSRFNRTVQEANDALADYRFDQYARACYDFFWRDFCDWYLEAIKPAMRDPARAGQTANVLAAVLDGSLRLMHPMIPFITETIWWRLNDTRAARGLPGRIECAASERLIVATWPGVGPIDGAAEAIMENFQALIAGIRNVRNTYKVDPKKPVNVIIVAPSCGAEQITAYPELVENLATCKIVSIVESLPTPPANSVRATAGPCEVYIEGLVDTNAERDRLTKRRDELTKQIAAMKGRLANTGYVAKAPPKLVQETKDQLAAAEAELAKLI